MSLNKAVSHRARAEIQIATADHDGDRLAGEVIGLIDQACQRDGSRRLGNQMGLFGNRPHGRKYRLLLDLKQIIDQSPDDRKRPGISVARDSAPILTFA